MNVGEIDGKHISQSHSTGGRFERGPNSWHHVSRGAMGGDMRGSSFYGIYKETIPEYVNRVTNGALKVFVNPKYTDAEGFYKADGHIHITCNINVCGD